jgi:hypothetical protein
MELATKENIIELMNYMMKAAVIRSSTVGEYAKTIEGREYFNVKSDKFCGIKEVFSWLKTNPKKHDLEIENKMPKLDKKKVGYIAFVLRLQIEAMKTDGQKLIDELY